MRERREALRRLPSVGRLLAAAELQLLVGRWGRPRVVGQLRTLLEEHRQRIRSSAPDAVVPAPSATQLAEQVHQRISQQEQSDRLRPVINGTGILLHTGLGRAPLASQAVDAMVAVAADYASVELDLESGQRGRRVRAVEGLLCELTGAEAALVVNNNAAATVLCLAALAAHREVVVSRGELIEIGGQFRLPEIMAASGAILREVGSTNRTRIGDYAEAIGESTGALLLVHPSNYVIVGFSEQVSLRELVSLGQQHGVPVVHDIGSGALIDFARFGFCDEPIAHRSIAQGAEVVLFSGDKLLGGPQCGILVGRRQAIERIERHPLARAMRVDKLTLAALAATLELYRDPDRTLEAVPLLRLLNVPLDQLRRRAERIVAELAPAATGSTALRGLIGRAEVVEDFAYLGGGAIPAQQQPTCCVAITPRELTVDEFARRMRLGTPAVVGRVHSGQWMVDLRTVFVAQDELLMAALQKLR